MGDSLPSKYALKALCLSIAIIVGVLLAAGINLALASRSLMTQPHRCWSRLNDDPADYASVQAAVDAANEGDIVKVAGYCTDVHTMPAPPDYVYPSINGLITQVVFISKTVTVQGGYTTTNWAVPDPIAYPTTLDAQGQGRVLCMIGNISPTVTGLHITGGRAWGQRGAPWPGKDTGGGVYVLSATATISHNWIYSNSAAHGGGLFLWDSHSMLSNNIVATNTAGGYGEYTDGGGLYLANSGATVVSNTFQANMAGHNGGGLLLLNSHDATLNRNTLISNAARFGGGAFLWYSDAALAGNTLVANTAYTYGGGLFMWYSDPTLTNNIIVHNQAGTSGSGLYINISSPRLLHTTLARNTGGDGAGVNVRSGTPSEHSTAVFINTILVSHTVGITVAAGNTATLEATAWGSGSWANKTDWDGAGVLETGATNVWGSVAFVDPEHGNYHIGPTSAAIDRGIGAGVTLDIDGDPRPLGAGYDIGADETIGPGPVFLYLPLIMQAYTPPLPPATGEFTPETDSGTIGQPVTFVTTYHDPNGWGDIAEASLMVNVWQKSTEGLLAEYQAASNSLQLLSDDGQSWVGSCLPGQASTLTNSYVGLDCAATTVAGNGDTLTIAWRVTPLAPFSGQYGAYLAFLMVMDATSQRVGWNFADTWTLNAP
jgi:hypothetical protein